MSLASRRVPVVALMALALIALVQICATDAEAGKKGKKAKVTVKVVTDSQEKLLDRGVLRVRVRATKRKKVTVRGTGADGERYFKRRRLQVGGKGNRAKAVRLPLTLKGRNSLGTCGAKQVQAIGAFRRGGKRVTTTDARKLTADARRCNPVPIENGSRCDFLDPRVCLQPFPNDHFTVRDPSTETGRRLALHPESMPANVRDVHIDPTDMNRADGFSPGNLITIKVPRVDTPKAFENSGLVPISNLRAYDDPEQAVIVINAETGERQPIWAELDSNPTSVDPSGTDNGGIGENPRNQGPVNLIIRPAENFDFGERYIVALRNLRDRNDEPVPAPIGFRVYRDEIATTQGPVEARRPHMESIIETLGEKAGVERDSLYMAWDFTVASQESVTGRALTIRDDAFARLGDTNLANRTIEGSSPNFTIDSVVNPGDPLPPGDRGLPDQIRRRVNGTVEVPCYLDQNGCPTGAKFAHDASGDITWDPSFTVDVPFVCEIPKSVETTNPGSITPAVPGTYGHGLLGDRKQVTGQAQLAQQSNTLWCAVDWAGFATEDLGTVASALQDMSNFKKMADRMQQGFVNFMYLGRALIHADGFSSDDAFKLDPDGAGGEEPQSVIDLTGGAGARLNVMGISQGGIMGGALTALEPDADRGVLGVPGMNYSTLLRRSVDSDEYFKLPGFGLYANYPSKIERPLLLSLVQLLWDRSEANGFAHNMTDNPLPNTPEHEVLLRLALGDHQVANVTAEVEARTIGAAVYTPALEPGRHWEANPFMGIPEIDMTGGAPYTGGSMLVYYDGGPVGFNGDRGEGTATPPDENVPPRPEWGYGDDPHGYPRASADGLNHAESFLAGDGVPQCAEVYCFSNGWTGAP